MESFYFFIKTSLQWPGKQKAHVSQAVPKWQVSYMEKDTLYILYLTGKTTPIHLYAQQQIYFKI